MRWMRYLSNGRDENCLYILVTRSEGNEPLRKRMHVWEDNIKRFLNKYIFILKEQGWKIVMVTGVPRVFCLITSWDIILLWRRSYWKYKCPIKFCKGV
jgi:hypothetical protein